MTRSNAGKKNIALRNKIEHRNEIKNASTPPDEENGRSESRTEHKKAETENLQKDPFDDARGLVRVLFERHKYKIIILSIFFLLYQFIR